MNFQSSVTVSGFSDENFCAENLLAKIEVATGRKSQWSLYNN